MVWAQDTLDPDLERQENRVARKLGRKWQLTAQSIPEVFNALRHVIVPDLVLRGVEFNDRQLYPGPLMNALALHFLDLPPGERERIAREYLGRLEGILESDQPTRLMPRADPVPVVVAHGKPAGGAV